MSATIYKVYDGDEIIFQGIAKEIAEHFDVSLKWVCRCACYDGLLKGKYRVVNSGKKEKTMKYTRKVYKVYDEQGNLDFQGSVPAIADHYFVTLQNVYAITEGKYKKLLKQYTLEYEGEEVCAR